MNKIDRLFLQSTLLHAKFEEVWLRIKGFTNYEVSSRGRIRNIERNNRLLKLATDEDGYHRISLRTNGQNKMARVHRLVAVAFCLNNKNKTCVDHIDGCKSNNKVENLRWVTSSENSMNVKKTCKNTSGVTGVSWHKHREKWQANISVNRKSKHLGYYDSFDAAKRARITAVTKHYGEFANKATNK
jgi:hypothetical protein